MTSSQLFGAMVRTIGLLMTLGAAAAFYFAALNLGMGGPASPGGILILTLPVFLVGLWLLRGTKSLIAFAYPEEWSDGRVGQPASDVPGDGSRRVPNWSSIAVSAGVLIFAIVVGLVVQQVNSGARLSDPIQLNRQR